MMPCEQHIHAKIDSLVQEDQECHHWKPDQEVIVHAPGSNTEVGGAYWAGGGRVVLL